MKTADSIAERGEKAVLAGGELNDDGQSARQADRHGGVDENPFQRREARRIGGIKGREQRRPRLDQENESERGAFKGGIGKPHDSAGHKKLAQGRPA